MPNSLHSFGLTAVLEKLGPFPAKTLETLDDLGLSDADISRYFNLSRVDLARVRQVLCVAPEIGDEDLPMIRPIAATGSCAQMMPDCAVPLQ
ncbi:MAG: hypothetical protein AAFQ66_02305 [Pseudomonadota bacterium]